MVADLGGGPLPPAGWLVSGAVLLVGLTGGIGSGKSTVAAALVERGAALVDADLIAREVVEPGGAAYSPLVDRFGPGIVASDGRIDRPALAAIAFGDPASLADLNAITHPAIGAVIATRIAEAAAAAVVVVDIPLLNAEGIERYHLDAVVVVDTPVDVAVSRLVTYRGFTEADARARVTSQISREERRALADYVVDNAGDRSSLVPQVDELWAALSARAAAAAG